MYIHVIVIIRYILRPVVPQDMLWVQFRLEVMNYLIFLFSCSGNEAKAAAPPLNAQCLKNRRKWETGVSEWEWSVITLVFQVPPSYSVICGIHREAYKKYTFVVLHKIISSCYLKLERLIFTNKIKKNKCDVLLLCFSVLNIFIRHLTLDC